MASSRIAATVPSEESLSTTISSSPSRSCAASGGSPWPTASRASWVTMTTETRLRLPGSAEGLEDPRRVAPGLGVRDLAVAELVDPDGGALDVCAALASALGPRDHDHMVVVGAEDLLRRGAELLEVLAEPGEEVSKAVRAAVGAAPGERFRDPGLGGRGDRVEHRVDVAARERIPGALHHIHVVLRHAPPSSPTRGPHPIARRARPSTAASRTSWKPLGSNRSEDVTQ